MDVQGLLRSRTLRSSLAAAVVIVAFVVALPSFASYGDVWDSLTTISPTLAVLVAIVGAANLVAPATSQRAALPGLRFRDAVASDWTTSAITNTVPGGSAIAIGVTWSMYRSYGLEHPAIARSVVVTGVWDTFVKFGTPLVAVLWLSTQRPIGPGLLQAAAVGGVLFCVVVGLGAVLLIGPAAARVIGSMIDRLPFLSDGWADRLARLRVDTIELLATRWRSLTFWTVAGHTNLFVLLVLCLRAVGVSSTELSAAAILAAFAFGRLVTAVPLSPGGVGVMEVSLTGALAAVGTADEAAIVAAVLIFRALTLVAPIPLGAITWMMWTARSPSRQAT